MHKRCWGLLLLAVVISASPVRAGDERSLYTINDVVVDETAASATQARKVALANGQRLAFDRLFTKLVAEVDQALRPALSELEIAGLIAGYDVSDEKTSATRYLARISVVFNHEAVRRLLGSLGVAFAETRTRATLVLPVLRHQGVDVLWGPRNPWFDAWRAYPIDSSLIAYVLAKNQPQDQILIDPRQALGVRPDRVTAISGRYDSRDLLVAAATLDAPDAEGRWSVAVAVNRAPTQQPLLRFQLAGKAGETVTALLDRAVVEVDRQLSENWKKQVLVHFGEEAEIAAHVTFRDFEGWRRLYAKLEAAAPVRAVMVEQLDITGARLRIGYFGGVAPLLTALDEGGLVAVEDGDRLELSLPEEKP